MKPEANMSRLGRRQTRNGGDGDAAGSRSDSKGNVGKRSREGIQSVLK